MVRSVLVMLVAGWSALASADLPADNPVAARYGDAAPAWTGQLPWDRVVDVTAFGGETADARLEAAMDALGEAGGVVYFPPGEYRFADDIVLRDRVILRGAAPEGVVDARDEAYTLRTRFEFPRYVPQLEGEGTPVETAFKHIRLARPERDRQVGVVHIAIHRGHIHFAHGPEYAAGRDRLVFGCILRNTAYIDRGVPDERFGQHPWQRWTARHRAAIHVNARENLLVAGNRIPRSGDDSFAMPGYVAIRPIGVGSMGFRIDRHRGEPTELEDVVFDYDNRPGIYANSYPIGPPQYGEEPLGTPESHPQGFRTGTEIRDNFIYATGRTAISFTGDGVVCAGNVIRMAPDVYRPTTTGLVTSDGGATNDNRAVRMHGYRWVVEDNDYTVFRNRAFDRRHWINDGEGLMHERHTNSMIVDSVLRNNRGNAYICIWRAPVDGLRIEGNHIDTDSSWGGICVLAERSRVGIPVHRVEIVGNTTRGRGISVLGGPATESVIRGNRHLGGGGRIRNSAGAAVEANEGFDEIEAPAPADDASP